MHSLYQEFNISKKEIDRRIYAFTSFIVCFFISLLIFSLLVFYNLIINNILFSLISITVLLATLFIFRLLTIRFFKSYLKLKICISNTFLERITSKTDEKYRIENIQQVTTKYTYQKNIREIKITFRDNYSLYLDGLVNFENFKEKLISYCKNNTEFLATKEPLDYDHPLFYIILGFILSFITIFMVKLLTNLDYESLKIFNLITILYILGMGLYFILNKPLTKRYGNKNQKADYLFGIFLLISVLIIYLLQ